MMAGIVQTLDVAGLWLVDAVIRVTIDGALVALPVWLACRFVTTLPASARAWLWWGVSLKLLLSLTGAPSLPIPVLPASLTPGAQSQSPLHAGSGSSEGLARKAEPQFSHTPALSPPDFATATSARQPRSESPTSAAWVALRIATAIWAAIVFAHLALLLLDALRLRRLLRRATRPSPAIEAEHEDLAKDLGLRRIPALRESTEVTTPQVVGLLRPTVLLPPASLAPMSTHERTMVLCHELAHVRRGDLILGWIPALAARVLAWHPLARLAGHEYALAREAACDALVLRTLDTAPRDYGRLLVRLGVHAPAVRVAAAGTSPTAHLLRRRLHMLQHASLSPRALTGVALTAAVLALLPLRLVGAPAIDADTPRTSDVHATATTATSSPHGSDVSEPAEAGQRGRSARSRDAEHKGHTWVYLYDDSDSSTMHGDTDDLRLAQRLRGAKSGAFFLYRQGDQVFTIDDRATLERIEAIFEPQHKLGEQQGELGERQGKLGEEQGKLGEQQGRLGERQGRVGAEHGEFGLRHAELAARMAEANLRQQRAAIERLREPSRDKEAHERLEAESRAQIREIERQMSELDRQLHELTERQESLGHEQEALGREQEKLGEKQEELGAEQEKLGALQEEAGRQAERELKELIERAIADGVAKRVK
jgi:bla regulator protein BlaR1